MLTRSERDDDDLEEMHTFEAESESDSNSNPDPNPNPDPDFAKTTLISSDEESSISNISIMSTEVVLTIWRRPDWLVIGRTFAPNNGTASSMEAALLLKRPILILEVKEDPSNPEIGDVEPGQILNMDHIHELVIQAIPQVLEQAQFIFKDSTNAGETIVAIIAIGTFCQDFTIQKSTLPPIAWETDPSYNPRANGKKGLQI